MAVTHNRLHKRTKSLDHLSGEKTVARDNESRKHAPELIQLYLYRRTIHGERIKTRAQYGGKPQSLERLAARSPDRLRPTSARRLGANRHCPRELFGPATAAAVQKSAGNFSDVQRRLISFSEVWCSLCRLASGMFFLCLNFLRRSGA